MKYYTAQKKQQIFHFAEADEVLYGGSAGGGKSYAIIWDSVAFCLQNPKVTAAVFRRTYPELEKSIILEALRVVPAHLYSYNKKEHRMYFNNGSILEFNYCFYDTDVYNFQSAQYDRMYFDELTHFSEYQYLYLMSRCRSTKGVKTQIKCASNPGNIGHEWVRQRFIVDAVPDAVITRSDLESGSEYTTQFIPARLTDNSYLMADGKYQKDLMKLPPEERRMLLEGDWDVLKGQFFSEFRYQTHVVKPFTIPDHWTRIRCMDWGYSKPACVLWVAFSPEGRAYVYRELRVTEMTDMALVAKVLDLSRGETYAYSTADPSLWSVNQYERGESIAMRMISGGLNIMKADNNRLAGWNVIHSYLACDEKEPPKMQIFENCHYLIKTLPGLIRDERNPEDVDTRGDDHAADALRYGLMTRPIYPKNPVKSLPQFSFNNYLKKQSAKRKEVGYVGTF